MSRCPSCGGPEHLWGSPCPEWQRAHAELSHIGAEIDDVRESIDKLRDATEQGFEELTETTRQGLERVEQGLKSVKKAIGQLETTVAWGFQLVTSQLGEAVDSLRGISAALRDPDWTRGKSLLQHGVASLFLAEPAHLHQVAAAAQTLFERAKEIMPTEWWPRVCLEVSLLLQGRLDEAEGELTESRAFVGGDNKLAAASCRLLAWVLFCKDELEGAIDECAKGLGYFDDPRIHFDLARYWVLAGSLEEARRHLEAAVRAEPALFAAAEKEVLFEDI